MLAGVESQTEISLVKVQQKTRQTNKTVQILLGFKMAFDTMDMLTCAK